MKHLNTKQLVSLLLASATALSMLAATACGNANEGGGNESSTSAITEGEIDTTDMDYVCELPDDLDYKGDEVNVLYADKVGRDDELPSEKLGLGVISDAVYERNKIVEDQLKITFNLLPVVESGIVAAHGNDVVSGAAEYDIVVNGVYMAIAPATTGRYVDLTPLSYVDTTKHYWSQGFNEVSTFTSENRQYLATGAAALSTYRLMYLTIYNKTLFESNQIPDLYDTVKNGEWTFDKQLEILTGHYDDADGNGKKSKDDAFGFITGDCVSTDPYLAAGNARMVVRDSELGELIFNSDAKAILYDLVEKVQAIYHNEATYVYHTSSEDDVGLSYIVENFAEQRSLMATLIFWNMEHSYNELAGMSYGIAPMPKLTKEQSRYYSYVQDQVSTFGVSAAVKSQDRREMLGAVLESMMYHSYSTVRQAYYETSLSYRYMQDEQSQEILKIVCDSQAYDFAMECCGLVSNTRPLFSGNKNTAASSVKSWEKSLTKQLQQYNKAINKIQG